MSHVLAEESKDEDDKLRDEEKVQPIREEEEEVPQERQAVDVPLRRPPPRDNYIYYWSKYVDSSTALNVRSNDVYL